MISLSFCHVKPVTVVTHLLLPVSQSVTRSLQAKKAVEEERLQRMQEQQTAEKKDAMQQELLRRAARKSVSVPKHITLSRESRMIFEALLSLAMYCCVQSCESHMH